MKKVLTVLLNFLKGIVRFIFFILISLGSAALHYITNEKGKERKITVRKAKRIRFFTNIKKFLGRHLWLADLIGFKEEIIDINKELNYGMQLRNDRTAKCAI